ncbi:MAG: hypothetical protein OHK0039_13190 [Bacteroidia bacterium]
MKSYLMLLFVLPLAACTPTRQPVVPLQRSYDLEVPYTIIWYGVSEAYRYSDGGWQRDWSYDYVFDVVQRRYDTVWRSVKTLHRLHPDYDGRAGARSQTMYFEMAYVQQAQALHATLSSSLGSGTGVSDTAFRAQTLEIDLADMPAMAPYNRLRITQQYRYEAGLLTETVELFKRRDGVNTPFMKNEERAWFFLRDSLDSPPTVWR